MATIIRIHRSTGTSAPGSLFTGEIAYTAGTGTQGNGGDRLYFGKGDDGSGNATTVEVIGGAYFANMLDHVAGTLTASSAIIVDASSKIDTLNVDNITIDGNAITSTDTNGNITLTPNGAGEVVASTLTVSDLTNNRIVIAGTSGAIEDDANLTFDGSNLVINTTSALQIPVGSNAQRPTAAQGQIRYNTDANQFEGYNGSNYVGLGGVIDADQDTKITAEITSGADSDALKFFTGGTLRMTLDSAALSLNGIDVIRSTGGSNKITIDPAPAGTAGELIVLGNLKVEGTTTTVNSTTVSLNDKNLVLADSAADSAEANDAGITINGPAVPVTFLYKSATDTIQFNRPLTAPSATITNLLLNYTTDNLSEGSSSLFYTDERVDDRVSNLLLAGEGIDLTYDDASNTLTVDGEDATLTNKGVASFGGYADSASAPAPGNARQFSVTSGDVSIAIIDGGTY